MRPASHTIWMTTQEQLAVRLRALGWLSTVTFLVLVPWLVELDPVSACAAMALGVVMGTPTFLTDPTLERWGAPLVVLQGLALVVALLGLGGPEAERVSAAGLVMAGFGALVPVRGRARGVLAGGGLLVSATAVGMGLDMLSAVQLAVGLGVFLLASGLAETDWSKARMTTVEPAPDAYITLDEGVQVDRHAYEPSRAPELRYRPPV